MIEQNMSRSLPWFMSYLWHGVCPVGSAVAVTEPWPSRHSTLSALTKAGASFSLAFPLQPLSKTLTVISQPSLICHLSLRAEQPKAGSGWVERNSESYRWSYCKELFNWWACQSFTMDAVYPTGLSSLPPVMIISTRCSSPKWMPVRQ